MKNSRGRTRSVASLFVIPVAVLAVGCSGSGSGSGGSSGADDALADLPAVAESDYVDMTGESTVVIDSRDNVFKDQYVVVSPGTKVEFDNVGRNPHNVIPVVDGAFEEIPVEKLQPGDTDIIVFDDAGEYPYYCSLHGTATKGMNGRIRVADE